MQARQQLSLFDAPSVAAVAGDPGLPQDVAGPQAFVRKPALDRSGLAAFLHLVRAADDPKRSAPHGKANRERAPHLRLKTLRIVDCRAAIAGLLSDGVARTFNRIAVELTGYTADLLFRGPFDEALWSLVDDGALELTLELPILFRLAAGDDAEATS